MAALDVLSLFFGKDPRTQLWTADGIRLPCDGVLAFDHTMESEITDSPVEDGSKISDSIIHAPREATLEGIVSDYPAKMLGGVLSGGLSGAGITGATDLIGGPLGDLFGKERFSQIAFRTLEQAWETRTALTVITRMRPYDDMYIQRLSIPQTKATANTLRFSMRLRQIKTVSSSLVAVTVAATVTAAAAPARKAGRQPPAPAPAPAADRGESMLHALLY